MRFLNLWKVSKGTFSVTKYMYSHRKGDVTELPQGSSPLDFGLQYSYRYREQNHWCKSEWQDGPVDYKLKNGDIIENFDITKFIRTKPRLDQACSYQQS